MPEFAVETTDGCCTNVQAEYYTVEDDLLLTFKDEKHKQVASFNLSTFVSVTRF